jgi:hypothetical protein
LADDLYLPFASFGTKKEESSLEETSDCEDMWSLSGRNKHHCLHTGIDKRAINLIPRILSHCCSLPNRLIQG